MLIPANYLVNGTSIVQAMPEGVEEIEYFHIELETHEVIFAEGAAAETLLVMKDREAFADLIREQFDNFAERKRLYGNDAPAYDAFRTPRLLQWQTFGVEGIASPSSISGRGHPRPDPVGS